MASCDNSGTKLIGERSSQNKSDEVQIAEQTPLETIEDVPDIEADAMPEYTAPVMITGASLTCKTVVKNTLNSYIEIACHLEKDGSILDDIVLTPFDIEVLDDSGENLILDFINQDDGSFIIRAVLKESSSLQISLKSIEGSEIESSDSHTLSVSISSDEIAATQESPQNEEQDANPPTENASEDNNNPTETQALDCSSLGAPGSWVLVPGDPNYGTNDFCIMKYEAKCSLANGQDCSASSDTESPNSNAQNSPWVIIGQQDAEAECASLGQGYHLITNPEWMSIATNIVGVSSNWSNGAVGNGQLIRGHSDTSPGLPCAASVDIGMNVVETDCSAKPSANDDYIEQRTHTLSNGEVIWDLSGNAWEWTNYFNDYDKPSPLGLDWSEYVSVTGTTSMPLTALVPQLVIDNAWSSAESIGSYLAGDNLNGGALLRGGSFGNTTNAGIFAAGLFESPTYRMPHVGFRCTYARP